MHEAVKADEKSKEIGEAHLSTPPTTIVNLESPSFVEVGHIFSCPIVQYLPLSLLCSVPIKEINHS